jgi:hypothetical protein
MKKVRMKKDEWLARGKELFGDDFKNWEFVCPICGHVQKIEDFRQFKDQGATPETAFQQCIGRFIDGRSAFNLEGPGPCDYAAYGLIRLAPVIVIDGDSEIYAFAFHEKELGAK